MSKPYEDNLDYLSVLIDKDPYQMEVQQIFSHWQLPLQKIIRTHRNEITCDVSKFQNSLTAQKIKFSIMDFFSKCDQIHSFQRTWSHLLKKSLIENFIFCAVTFTSFKIKFLISSKMLFCSSQCACLFKDPFWVKNLEKF